MFLLPAVGLTPGINLTNRHRRSSCMLVRHVQDVSVRLRRQFLKIINIGKWGHPEVSSQLAADMEQSITR